MLRSPILARDLLTAALATVALWGCGDEGVADPITAPPEASDDGAEGELYVETPEGKADGFTPVEGPLTFEAACAPGDRVVIAAVGDALIHGRLQKQALAASEGFASLWGGVPDLLASADITYANLEGPTAAGVSKQGRAVTDPGRRFDDWVYSSYPMFNYHPSLIDDLMASGVDVVSTANNHSLDRWALGADRTIEALTEKGLPFTGTRPSDDPTHPWWTTTEANGLRLAWLACTYGTNGLPDREDQVLNCFDDRAEVLGLVRELAARDDLDAVLVTPHWGQEYHAAPSSRQVDLAHDLLDAGALAVIGSHPHVLQPWEKYTTADGREGFVIYSLGNFVSGQRNLPRRSTLLLYLGLTRGADGVTRIHGARYVPLHMTQRSDLSFELEAIDRVGGHGDSRALTVDMFGQWNVLPAGFEQSLATPTLDPQCDPAWQPPAAPHDHDGWIGGRCEVDEACGGAQCVTGGFPEGICTETCERYCPDRAGRATTFCATVEGVENTGLCLAQCEADAECRAGYACQVAPRFGEAGTVKRVCLPSPE